MPRSSSSPSWWLPGVAARCAAVATTSPRKPLLADLNARIGEGAYAEAIGDILSRAYGF